MLFRRSARRVAGGMLAAAALLVLEVAAAQSELVIYKEGTSQYHRADCPVIRDMVKVVAMTRAQAESRGYKSHPDCDPANAASRSTGDAAAAPSQTPAVTIYLDGSRYYHRKDCPRLAKTTRKVEARPLDQAGKTWPCPACKPPSRKKNIEPAVPGTERRRGR